MSIYHIISGNYPACSSCDYACLKPGLRCPMQSKYRDEVMKAVMNSDLTYFVIPDFCGGPNGNFYEFNERSVGFFKGNCEKLSKYMAARKKFIIVSNTESDAFKAAMRQKTKDEPDVLYLKTNKYKRVSIAGDLMECYEAKIDLQAFINSD